MKLINKKIKITLRFSIYLLKKNGSKQVKTSIKTSQPSSPEKSMKYLSMPMKRNYLFYRTRKVHFTEFRASAGGREIFTDPKGKTAVSPYIISC